MKNKLTEYYSMAKFISREVFYEAQMKQAGSRQAKFLEKCEKNKKYIGRMVLILKIVSSFMIILLPLIYLISVPSVLDLLKPSGNIEITAITYGIVFSIFIISYMTYLILFGLYTIGAFMSGDSFNWLRTLPISKKKLRKYAFMTLFRSIDLQLISLCVALPILIMILTQNVVLMLMSFLISIPNAILCLCVLIFLGEKISRVIFSKENTSKKSSRTKILVFGLIISVSIGMNLILQFIFYGIEGFVSFFTLSPDTHVWNLILSLIPYPFGPIYFITLFISPTNVPPLLILTSTIGFLLFLGITYVIGKKALKSIKSVIGTEKERKSRKSSQELKLEEINIKIKESTTTIAYIKKDLTTAARDPQSAMLLIMPIMITIIMILSFSSGLTEVSDLNIQLLSFLMISLVMISTINPIMLVSGLMNMEESGSTITSALPILPRDQAKAKLILMILIQTISFIIPTIISSIILQNIWFLIVGLCSMPLSLTFLFIAFLIKIMLFGKMKYKYITEEIFKEKKIRKWTLIILINLGLVMLNFTIISLLVFLYFEIWFLTLASLLMGGIILCILLAAFDNMFPTLEKLRSYKTGGSLRNNPIIGMIVVLLLYLVLPLVVVQLIGSLIFMFPISLSTKFTILNIVEPITKFSTLFLLFLSIVPKWLRLPYGTNSLNQYFKDIKISNRQPILKNIFIGIGSFLILIIPLLVGSIFLGNYSFDLGRIFEGYGGYIFLFMLIPVILEEIAFRGVMTSMSNRKYKIFTTIFISGILFGIAHIINFLAFSIDPLNTILQVIYASFIGFALSYMFLKTKSLIPSMIFHYIFNIFNIIFTPVSFDKPLLLIIYSVIFIGIIPMILIILFVKIIKTKVNLKRDSI